MRLRTLIIPILFTTLSLRAQFDPEAADIIKPVSEAILNASGVKVDFVFTIENNQTDVSESDTGQLLLKGNKFKLFLLGTETCFDGKSQWVYMVDENEVTVSAPDPDDEMELTPYTLFTLYEKGFRFKIVEESANVVTIDMIPDDRTLPYHKIQLTLDTMAKTFEKVIAFGRDGMNTTVIINAMKKDLNLNESEFVFNASKHPDVEVIDMR